jgi:CheY-like chemotaxis protein
MPADCSGLEPCEQPGLRILVVEDEAPIAHFINRILARNGYQVSMASDGGSALALLEDGARAFDLLLTDINMPGMNGLELARQVRAVEPKVNVLFTSGQPGDMDWQSLGKFLAKPFTMEALLEAVRDALCIPVS